MATIYKSFVKTLRGVDAFLYEHGACGHDVAVGQQALGVADAVGSEEPRTSCGQQTDGGVLVVFAVYAVGG